MVPPLGISSLIGTGKALGKCASLPDMHRKWSVTNKQQGTNSNSDCCHLTLAEGRGCLLSLAERKTCFHAWHMNSAKGTAPYSLFQSSGHEITLTALNHDCFVAAPTCSLLAHASQKLTCGQVNGVLLCRTPCLHGSTINFLQLHFTKK